VYPRPFEYVRPSTVHEAVDILSKNVDRAKILAGGQSLIPLMKLRIASPQLVVDINRLPGLDFLKEEGGTLRIGALVRHRDVERSRIVQTTYPLLSDAAQVIGDPQVRNLGTAAGSLAHADPASDWGTALLAFESRVDLTGPKGTRTVPIDDFFTDTFATSLGPDEILTEIRVPRPGLRAGGAYAKLKRKTGDFATVATAAQVGLDSKGSVSKVRIALAAVGPTPIRSQRAERFLLGKEPSASVIEQTSKAAVEDSHPSADLRGSEAYKRAMVELFTRRALERAVERARS
jgi:aerobic carbon-monoxide dehydrogenase medium subunit